MAIMATTGIIMAIMRIIHGNYYTEIMGIIHGNYYTAIMGIIHGNYYTTIMGIIYGNQMLLHLCLVCIASKFDAPSLVFGVHPDSLSVTPYQIVISTK